MSVAPTYNTKQHPIPRYVYDYITNARVEIAYGVNTAGNEAYFAAKVPCGFVLITRLSSHAVCDSTPAHSI